MRNHLAASLALILALAPAANAGIIVECVREVLQEKLEKTIDQDFKSSKYWGELLGNTAKGTPEVAVKQIMDDYSLDSLVKDTGLKMLGKLVPQAAGPIGLFMSASELAHQYTRDMLDFYKKQHLRNFVEAVIEPSSTRQQLKSNYDKFLREYVDLGQAGVNVLYAERAGLENQFYEMYLQRFRILARADKAKEAKLNAQRIVVAKLKAMQKKAMYQAQEADAYLEAAEFERSKKNILKYISDGRFRGEVKAAAKKKLEEARKKKKEAEKNDQTVQVEPKVPAVSNVKQLIEAEAASILTDTRIHDYSPYSENYSKLADAYIAGETSSDIYRDTVITMNSTVFNLKETCLRESAQKGDSAEEIRRKGIQCYNGYDRYKEEVKAVDETVEARRKDIIARLEELRKIKEPSPFEFIKNFNSQFIPAYHKEAEPVMTALRACDALALRGENMKEIKSYLSGCSSALNTYNGLIARMEDKYFTYSRVLDRYADALSAALNDYNEFYFKNAQFIEDHASVYEFKDETRMLEEAQSFVGFYGDMPDLEKLEGMKRYAFKIKNLIPQLIEEYSKNENFIARAENLLKAAQALNKYTNPSGEVKILANNYLDEYYAQNIREDMTYMISGALQLLSPNISGDDTGETISLSGKSEPVYTQAVRPYFATLDRHESTLAGLKARISEITAMNLPGRLAQIAAINKEIESLYKGLRVTAPEARELYYNFEMPKKLQSRLEYATRKLEPKDLMSGFKYTLNTETLNAVAGLYSERIQAAKAKEKELLSTFKKYQTQYGGGNKGQYEKDWADATGYMGKKKWVFSQQLYEEMGKANDAQLELMSKAVGKDREKEAADKEAKEIETVRDFYNKFKSAYESRNPGAVLNMISGEWQSMDGTDLSDLSETLRNNFRLYNEIRLDISALKIKPHQKNISNAVYSADYTLTITSRIYSRNLKHEEKSEVHELVDIDYKTGKTRIIYTNGQYWSIK